MKSSIFSKLLLVFSEIMKLSFQHIRVPAANHLHKKEMKQIKSVSKIHRTGGKRKKSLDNVVIDKVKKNLKDQGFGKANKIPAEKFIRAQSYLPNRKRISPFLVSCFFPSMVFNAARLFGSCCAATPRDLCFVVLCPPKIEQQRRQYQEEARFY